MDGGSIPVRLHCRHTHQACRGVILLAPRGHRSVRLARMHFRIPARRTRTLDIGLSSRGAAYLEAHERTRVLLRAHYPGGPVDSFRLTVIG